MSTHSANKLATKVSSLSDTEFEKWVDKESIVNLHRLKSYLDDQYYNKQNSILPDYRYDRIDEQLQEKDPNYEEGVGASVSGDKVKLPYFLGSQRKIKPSDSNKLNAWLKTNKTTDYVVSSKLDGVSCLAVYKDGKLPTLYTRGNGNYGQDISWIIEYVPSIPKSMAVDIDVRGELIIESAVFKSKLSKHGYVDGLSAVGGLIGAKKPNPDLKYIHFVTYEVLSEEVAPKPSVQFDFLEENGFEVAKHQLVSELGVEMLEGLLTKFLSESRYNLDGIVVQSDKPIKRSTAKYPKYSFAFKVDGPTAQTTVKHIEWNVGKTKRLVPTAVIETVVLGERNNSRASAHNARYVEQLGIGPGAVVEIVRSGGIIPKIIKVVKPAKPEFPDGDYKWDANNVHIIAEGQSATEEACLRRMHSFFKAIGIKELGPANLKKIYANGLNTVLKIMTASEQKISTAVESEAIGKKIWKYIQIARSDLDIPFAIGASGILGEGIGTERAVALAEAIPDIFTQTNSNKVEKQILAIPGFGTSIASTIAKNIKCASILAKTLSKISTKKPTKPSAKKSNKLDGELIVVTGFTDKELEKDIASHGGKYTTNWNKNATAVVAGKKSLEKGSSKIDKANDAGIPVYSVDEFQEKLANL